MADGLIGRITVAPFTGLRLDWTVVVAAMVSSCPSLALLPSSLSDDDGDDDDADALELKHLLLDILATKAPHVRVLVGRQQS